MVFCAVCAILMRILVFSVLREWSQESYYSISGSTIDARHFVCTTPRQGDLGLGTGRQFLAEQAFREDGRKLSPGGGAPE